MPMKLHAMIVGLFLAIAVVQPSNAMVRIDDDRGGLLGEYLLKFATIRDSGERIMIDGSCYSACTLVTALIPKQRICVTERARLGFHAGWVDDQSGQQAVSIEGTDLMYQMYPREIQRWIKLHGGLGKQTLFLKGRELMAVYPACQ
jgi:hypothetical protein